VHAFLGFFSANLMKRKHFVFIAGLFNANIVLSMLMLNPTKTTRPKQTDQNTASASLVLAGIKRPGTQLVAG